jgi:hypothetical protein
MLDLASVDSCDRLVYTACHNLDLAPFVFISDLASFAFTVRARSARTVNLNLGGAKRR